MTSIYLKFKISREVQDEVESITGTLPGKVYYSADGEALILCNDDKYVISVELPDPSFHNGNPTTHSAYLASMPVVDLVDADPHSADPLEYKGWAAGWEA